jgi:hypothetical protein
MPTPAAPSDPKAPEIHVSFEDRLRVAWERNGNMVYIVLCFVAAAVLGKGAMDYFSAQKELAVQQAYAACTAPDMLRAFADSHRGHPLAGVAELRVADMAYESGRFAEASTGYGQAIPDLSPGPLLSRAKLGLAVSEAQSGRASDAEAALRQLLGDEGQPKPVRCEAAYQLAVLEVSQGRPGEVQSLMEKLMQIDPSSPFAERIVSLRPQAPVSGASLLGPAAAPAGR